MMMMVVEFLVFKNINIGGIFVSRHQAYFKKYKSSIQLVNHLVDGYTLKQRKLAKPIRVT